MPTSTTRTVGPAVNTIDASALERPRGDPPPAQGRRHPVPPLRGASPGHGPAERVAFLAELSGNVQLIQSDAASGINPDLARRALKAERVISNQ